MSDFEINILDDHITLHGVITQAGTRATRSDPSEGPHWLCTDAVWNGDAEGDGYVSLGSKAALAMAEQFSDEMDAAAQAADDEQRESSALSRARAMAAAAYMGDRW
jgi:hypothetical protein